MEAATKYAAENNLPVGTKIGVQDPGDRSFAYPQTRFWVQVDGVEEFPPQGR